MVQFLTLVLLVAAVKMKFSKKLVQFLTLYKRPKGGTENNSAARFAPNFPPLYSGGRGLLLIKGGAIAPA